MASSFDRSAILESFLKELQAYLPEIEMNLDRARQGGADAEALEEIYRRVHTIAGSAGMVDLPAIAQVATAMETVMGDVLDGAMPLNDATTGLLRRSVGRLRQLMELARTGANDSTIITQDRADHMALRGSRTDPSMARPAPAPRAMGGPGLPPDANMPVQGGPPRTGTGPTPVVPFPNAPQPFGVPQPAPGASPPFGVPQQPTPFGASQPIGLPPAAAPGLPPAMARPGWLDQSPPAAPPPYDPARLATQAIPVLPSTPDAPSASVVRLSATPLWHDVQHEEEAVRQSAAAFSKLLATLREVARRFDGERNELSTFLDSSPDALERLEQWAGQSMGIDLRTSPDHVRRYLPLSVLWVVTARMKRITESLQDASRSMVMHQEALDEAVDHLGEALSAVSQMAGGVVGAASLSPNGGFTASVTEFSYAPAARTGRTGDLSPGARAEVERAVREELRRELEDEVRAEVANDIRAEEAHRLRQELRIEVRRELLAELNPLMSGGMPTMDAAAPAAPPARRVVTAGGQSEEMLDVFRAEAEEHLRTIGDGLNALELNHHDTEAIRAIRRAMHTLKGAAGITGFDTVADLAHLCEDLLDRINDGTLDITPEVVSLVLDTSQALEALIDNDTGEQGGNVGIVAALRPRYQTLLGETMVILPAVTPSAPAAVSSSTIPRPALRVAAAMDDDEAEAGTEAPIVGERPDADLSVRLSLRKLDELLTLFGDIIVNRSVVEERMGRLANMVRDSILASDRLRDIGTQLDRQFETPMMLNGRNGFGGGNRPTPPPKFGGVVSGPNAAPADPDHRQWDSLEMDEYGEFHRLSRGLVESATDANALSTEMEVLMREMEVAVLREGRLSSRFQDSLLKARLVPLSSLVPRLYRAIRAIAAKYGKEFNLYIEGEDTEIDRGVYEDISAPMLHLVRNAIYHGIESPDERLAAGKPAQGQIVISARYEGTQLLVSVRDDGRGLNPPAIRSTAQVRGLIDSFAQLSDREVINLIFQPGFSTAETITEEAGRGVGLDVVRDTLNRLRGNVEVDSTVGQGSTFTLSIPISLQIQLVVLVRVADQTYAIPMAQVAQLVQLDYYPRAEGSTPALDVQGTRHPLVHMASYLHLTASPISANTPTLLINSGTRHWALMVDAIAGRQEIVAKSLGPHLKNVPTVSGATVLGNGQVVLILDPLEMLTRPQRTPVVGPTVPPPGTVLPMDHNNARGAVLGDQRVSLRPPSVAPARHPAASNGSGGPQAIPYILVVDDSPSVRRVVSATLKNAGWDVLTARDGQEALEIVAQRIPAGILLDIEMPRMDGYDLMAALRKQPTYGDIPLIVLTSRAATKHQQRALQLGADAYVVKPYQDDQLLTTLNELVRVRPNGDPR